MNCWRRPAAATSRATTRWVGGEGPPEHHDARGRGEGPAEAAVHGVHHRRAGGPDDDQQEVEHSIIIAQKARPCGRDAPDRGDAASAGERRDRPDQEQHAGPRAFKVASAWTRASCWTRRAANCCWRPGRHAVPSPRPASSPAQGTLVDDKEIRRVVKFLRRGDATFERSLLQIRPGMSPDQAEGGPGPALGAAGYTATSTWGDRDGFQAAQEDPMFDQAVEIVIESRGVGACRCCSDASPSLPPGRSSRIEMMARRASWAGTRAPSAATSS